MNIRSLAAMALVAATLVTTAAQAQTQTLKNLTTVGATIADGNKRCPDQPYYLYSGGKPDQYLAPADRAYPRPDLLAFIPPGGPVVSYDTPMMDGRFGDSFNLQNTRSVCHAVIQFKAKATNGLADNDGLTFGHVQPGGGVFDVVGQVINPGNPPAPGIQSYALDATGLALLSAQTGVNLDRTVEQSVLDLYLQDDTMLDFFRAYVWYGPNCSETEPNTCRR